MKKNYKLLPLPILLAVGSLFASSASGQSDDSYYYGGLSIGQSRAKIDEDRITANLLGAGLTTTAMTRDERDTAFKVFAGYQVNRYFGLEAGYFNLGKFGFTSTTSPRGTLDGSIKLQGLNVDAIGTLPLVGSLSAFGRIGVQYARARDSFTGEGAVNVFNPNPRKSAANYKVGAGLQYAINPSILVRGEAERYRVDDAVGNKGDVNFYSVSLVFPFGRTPTPAPRPAAAVYVPPPVAVAPPVVVAAAPAPVEPRRVSFSADSLFGFDRSDIKPEGKAALDAFAKEVVGTRYDVITVEGHTDRLGSKAYNQRLSTRRAEAVKAYLASAGIDAAKISAVGKGESDPKTTMDTCKGSKLGAKLIACLQPDRRVDVQVAGTR